MKATQRKEETFIPNVSCAIPKKGQKEKKEKKEYSRDWFKHRKISHKKRESYLENIIVVDCFHMINNNFVALYLRPQRRLVSHPLFLENSCDVSLWLSAGNKSKRKNQLQTL